MEGIITGNISKIELNMIGIERKYDSEGNLAVDSLIREMYVKKEYCLTPKSTEEARVKGLKFFNGLMSSVPRLNIYLDQFGQAIVCADVAPTRYMVGQAMRDVVNEGKFKDKAIQKMSPRMLNVSLIVPVELNNKYYLLSQIKGHTLSSGKIHAALVAGNVDARYLLDFKPLISALKTECKEESGVNLSNFDYTFSYLFDEYQTGHINFAVVSKGVDLDKVLNIYESQTKAELLKDMQPEVAGLCLLPIGGPDRLSGNVDCFFPTEFGLVKKKERREFNLYTRMFMNYLSKQENAESLLKIAGF